MGSQAQIILYTNRACPWAHRADIALRELGLPYEEVIIPLDKPREPWYLKVNPRGLVPSLSYDGEILTESAVVAQFLADAYPAGKLLPESSSPSGALRRARIAFFTDTYQTKVHSLASRISGAKTDTEAEKTAEAVVGAIVKEVEPLLAEAAPFFGGSNTFGFAEVLTAPHVFRLVTLSKAGVHPTLIATRLQTEAPNFTKWAEAVVKHPSVTAAFPTEKVIENGKKKVAKARATE